MEVTKGEISWVDEERFQNLENALQKLFDFGWSASYDWNDPDGATIVFKWFDQEVRIKIKEV